MEGLLIEQSGGVAGLAVDGALRHGSHAMMIYNDPCNTYSSISSLNHPFLNLGAAVFGPYGSRRPPLPLYSSLPSSFASARAVVSPPPPLLQPPLLPLPSTSNPATLPLVSKKINDMKAANKTSSVRLRDQRKKRKPPASLKKETPLSTLITTGVCQPKSEPKEPIEKTSVSSEAEHECEEQEKESVVETVYLVSPPPSSLPLPSFSLTRLKSTAASSCITAKAVARSGGGSNSSGGAMRSGAADQLRRLLHL